MTEISLTCHAGPRISTVKTSCRTLPICSPYFLMHCRQTLLIDVIRLTKIGEFSTREFCSPSTLDGYFFTVSTNPCVPVSGEQAHDVGLATRRLLSVLVNRCVWGSVLGHARLSQSTLTLRYSPVPFNVAFWHGNRNVSILNLPVE